MKCPYIHLSAKTEAAHDSFKPLFFSSNYRHTFLLLISLVLRISFPRVLSNSHLNSKVYNSSAAFRNRLQKEDIHHLSKDFSTVGCVFQRIPLITVLLPPANSTDKRPSERNSDSVKPEYSNI